MELIGSLFLILALVLIVGLFIARPFMPGYKIEAGEDEPERDHQRSALMAERDRALTALQELDFDNAMGKIPAENYTQQRAILLKAGADALRRLDEFPTDGVSQVIPSNGNIEDRIEAAVAARRADSARQEDSARQRDSARQKDAAHRGDMVHQQGMSPQTNGANGNDTSDVLENIIASRKRQRRESAGGFCPRCGKPVSKSDKFCSKCGATL